MLRSRSHPHTFQERLDAQKAHLEKKASQLKPGPEREDLLRRAEQVNEWLNSSGLQPPR
jgi:hypothetical protein